eukprot:CAMPEP_0114488896 /NCGR_PEP_ID=MMETSP0109-20121206/1582_1 /TAXON_ID=29199 /ORGANISM="Chlorarachnion reptans, Strain CCCM449" /LENGTH=364 /DNA_ID=CAMNT_0001665335 /DNA_START=329 /DNA_END=1426 /DNA_ORIENTATION=-
MKIWHPAKTLPRSSGESNKRYANSNLGEMRDNWTMSPRCREINVDIQNPSKGSKMSNFRNVTASVIIHAPPGVVWQLLTDYEHLGEVVPNLAVNEVLDRWEGGAKIYQVGEQRVLPMDGSYSRFSGMIPTFRAKCTLECEEYPADPTTRHSEELRSSRITFKLIEGDFEEFAGSWIVQPSHSSQDHGARAVTGTILWYNLGVRPSAWLPVSFIEKRLADDVRANLGALREAAEGSRTYFSPATRRTVQAVQNDTMSRNPVVWDVSLRKSFIEDFGLLPVDIAPPTFVPYFLETSVGRAIGSLPIPVPSFLLPLLVENVRLGKCNEHIFEWLTFHELFASPADFESKKREEGRLKKPIRKNINSK